MAERGRFTMIVLGMLVWLTVSAAEIDVAKLPPAVKERVEFRRDVLPILKESCFGCHRGKDAESGYRLDVRAELLGETNGEPLVVVGKSAASRLIHLVAGLLPDESMPPDGEGEPLTGRQVGVLRAWIDQGVEWDEELLPAVDIASRHWSFQPITRPTLPEVQQADWARNPIDLFILRRLEAEGIAPSPEADRRTLIRRLCLDLIGLPPSPADVEDFVRDDHPDAYARLVDRLLASPYYGERWARPWLDLCHYADTDGYLTDQLRPYAWRYRHWLVEALNRDLPFDEFTVEQLAGDLLPGSTVDQRIATGFLRQTLSNREGGADPEEFRVHQIVDRAMTAGTTWLGLTVGCARCHNHKFDPITTREFYELYAFFENASEINIDAPTPNEIEPYLKEKPFYDAKRREVLAPVEADVAALQHRWEAKILEARAQPGKDHRWDRQWELLGLVWGGGLGEGQLEGWEIALLDPAKRTALQKDRLLDYFLRSGSIIDGERFKELKLSDVNKKLSELKDALPKITRAPTMHHSLVPRKTYIHVRGDFRARGGTVEPGTPKVLPPISERTHPGRLELARWLVSPANPLTSRVTVNRVWQEFFGYGLVLTSNDFGTQGDEPTHPELLDWLATALIDRGWSLKELHRLIVTSAVYRQSSKARPEFSALDPNNRLLARQSSLRLSAEAVRDTSLAVSDLLHRTIGGPSVRPPQPESVTKEGYGNKWTPSEGKDRYRRGLYTFVQRTSPFAQNVTFDGADPNATCTLRERSNTPLQSLTLLNDPVFFEAAQALAERLLHEAPPPQEGDGLGKKEDGTRERLRYAFRLCLARPPSGVEEERLLAYYRRQVEILHADPNSAAAIFPRQLPGVEPAEAGAWTGVSSVLLNLHEFITRE